MKNVPLKILFALAKRFDINLSIVPSLDSSGHVFFKFGDKVSWGVNMDTGFTTRDYHEVLIHLGATYPEKVLK
jgi:hypothetical protein